MTKKLTKKQLGEDNYISPEIKTVEFKAEGPLCTSFTYYSGGGGVYELDDINDNGSY